MRNNAWIPKLRIDSENRFFVEQILRVIEEKNIAVDVVDRNEEAGDDYLIIVTDHELTQEEEEQPIFIVYVISSIDNKIEESNKRIVLYQQNLSETSLADKLESLSLILMAQSQESRVVQNLSKQLMETRQIVEDYERNMDDAWLTQMEIMRPPENMGDFKTFTTYVPLRKISGDVLFVKQIYNKVFIMIADVTDHGFLAGLYGAALYTLAHNYVFTASIMDLDVSSWANYMQRTSKMFYPSDIKQNVAQKIKSLLSASATFVVIDKEKSIADMCFCGSGGEPPILVNMKNGKLEANLIKIDAEHGISPPVGNGNFLAAPKRIKFYPGSQLVFYTDGATEIFLDSADTGEKDAKKIFSSEKIVKSVREAIFKNKTSPKDIVSSILDDASAYSISTDLSKNKEIPNLDDDITIFCIKYKENE